MRWRRVLLITTLAVFLTLAGGGIGVYVWLDHYRPLSNDAGGWALSAHS